ncbi:MAG: hypothetical protein MUE69_03610 [Myxococcota bacterium]|nr:hypothetical protein [Myxococcota bacterium]
MRKMMMGLVALGAIGCGGESGEELVQSVLESFDDAVRFECGCAWEEYEYASEAECLSDNLYTNAEKDCLAAAVGPVAELNPRHVKCIRNASNDLSACIERFGCGVTDAQIASCEAEVATRCGGEAGEESLCFGLSGDALSNCLAEEARADAATEACFPE